jgi:hypothetical protein
MINFLDSDNTCDRLFAQRIKPAILSMLTNALSTKGIFDHTMPIALIEREAPGALNPWADNWSGKMFDFLKKLSWTHILDDGYLNGSAYGFEPEYTADLPDLIDLDAYHVDTFTVRIPSGATGIVTWLERTHDEQSAPYCDKLTNRLTIAMRRSRLFKNTAAEPLEIEIYTKNWLHNSVCFQGVELVGISGKKADFLLYQNMQNFLDYLWGELNIGSCKVLTGCVGKQTILANSVGTGSLFTLSNQIEFFQPVFSEIPSHYFVAVYSRGEIQEGNLTVIFEDEKITLDAGFSRDFYASNAFPSVNASLSLDTSPVPFNASLFSSVFPRSDASGVFAFDLIHAESGDANGYTAITGTQENQTRDRIFPTGGGKFSLERRVSVSTGATGYSSTDHVRTANVHTRTRSINPRGKILGFGQNDPLLFSNFRIGFVSASFELKNEVRAGTYSDSVSELDSQDISRIFQNISGFWAITYNRFAEEAPLITGEFYQQDSMGNYYAVGTVSAESQVILARNFGDDYDPPDLVIVGAEIALLRDAEASTQLELILYPDGPDGDPYLDPDPDNGDIMPDSIRIKEIHAALEADKYGVHPEDSENDPKKRLNNLGRLIESAAHVLGVSFNEDGKNVPYPEPRLFDPEKIEDINDKKLLKPAQFAVAEMGGFLDTSGIYEVRSAIPKMVRNEMEIDLRPHGIKVHNLPQLIDGMADDISKMLGGGQSAAFQVPSADGWRAAEYEGISQAVADALYMLSVHSKNINELQNQSIKTVYMLQQILKGLGLPTHIEKIEGVSGVTDAEGEYLTGYMPVPEIDPKSPTITSLLGIVLLNLQRVVGASVTVREYQQEEA